MAETKKLVGMAGLFGSSDDLIRAARHIRDAGFRRWDCHTPYPVHGIDRAMGLKSSPLAIICLTMGFGGVGLAMLMQWWMSAIDFPIVIGGKPLFSWPAFVPITFDLFVLFTSLTAMGSIVAFCKLGKWHSPLHDSDLMAKITSDGFAVVLNAADEHFSEDSSRALLIEAGCNDIRPLFELEDEDTSFL